MSLLHFALAQMERAHPGEMDVLMSHAPLVQHASNIQTAVVKSWLDEMTQGLREVQREIQAAAAEQQLLQEQSETSEDGPALQVGCLAGSRGVPLLQ